MMTFDIDQFTKSIKGTKVIVIGDVMLDRYLRGIAERQSPEANVQILDHRSTETKLGGAANVALNFKAFGCEVTLITIAGTDDASTELQGLLDVSGIDHRIIPDPLRPTTVKTRIIAENQHLLRVDFESVQDISPSIETRVLKSTTSAIEEINPDILVFQDYNKGLLTRNVIQSVIKMSKEHNIFTAVDPKKSNFWEYTSVDMFKPNLRETEDALDRSFPDREAWSSAANELQERLKTRNVALTLGSQGIMLQATESCYKKPQPIDVIDVCGAGDAVLMILSLMFWKGMELSSIADVANLVGGTVCQFSGVQIVTPELFSEKSAS